MCALPGRGGPRAHPPLALFLLCLLAAARLSGAGNTSPVAPFTSLPGAEETTLNYSNLSLESYNISLTESSDEQVGKNITLERPSHIKLTCQFTKSVASNSFNVTWKKDDEELSGDFRSSETETVLYTQYKFTVNNSSQMGSYSCFFGEKKEYRGTFNFKVPEIEGKNKPMISYVGDSAILMCKCHDCSPTAWIWSHSNGSVQVPIDIQTNEKFYVINGTNNNETKLKIMQLSEQDGGFYWCQAVFQLGESGMLIELVVLSYLVPLKPFLAIVAEVVVLVAIILLCEMYTQKKKSHSDDGKEFEQIEQLKSDDSSNGIENNAPRHRINSVTSK